MIPPSPGIDDAARKAVRASLSASSLGTIQSKFIRLLDLNDRPSVSRATELPRGADLFSAMQYANDFLPYGDIRVRCNVANEMHAVLCTTAKSVDTVVARKMENWR